MKKNINRNKKKNNTWGHTVGRETEHNKKPKWFINEKNELQRTEDGQEQDYIWKLEKEPSRILQNGRRQT